MRKNLLKTSVMLALFACCGIKNINAQIADFDADYCYQIIINNKEYAMGIPEDGVTVEEACLQQQEIDVTNEVQLWKLELLESENVYQVVNLASDMALGTSTWRIAPSEGSGQDTPTSPSSNFSWNGSHPGIVQRAKDESNPEQQWVITSIADTIYNIGANFDLDSAKYWNFWSGGSGVGLDKKNIALFPTLVAESDRIGDGSHFYAFFFVKTEVANPDNVVSVHKTTADNIRIYSNNGYIRITGDLEPGKQIKVYSVLGNLIESDLSTGAEYTKQVKSGIYIVKVGEKVAKVSVR